MFCDQENGVAWLERCCLGRVVREEAVSKVSWAAKSGDAEQERDTNCTEAFRFHDIMLGAFTGYNLLSAYKDLCRIHEIYFKALF